MKLYPILFNEAAKTPIESISENIVALMHKNAVYLLKQNKFIEDLKEVFEKYGKPSFVQSSQVYDKETDEAELDFFSKKISELLSKDSMKALITLEETSYPFLFKVITSAATESYGPLAYQIAMFLGPNQWLKSDSRLTDEALKVWNKMYQYSENGTYKRLFLGKWGESDLVKNSILANKNSKIKLAKFIENPNITSEEEFLKFLNDNNLKPDEFGHMWAYTKTEHDPLILKLFENGKNFLRTLQEEFNISEYFAMIILKKTGWVFFDEKYL